MNDVREVAEVVGQRVDPERSVDRDLLALAQPSHEVRRQQRRFPPPRRLLFNGKLDLLLRRMRRERVSALHFRSAAPGLPARDLVAERGELVRVDPDGLARLVRERLAAGVERDRDGVGRLAPDRLHARGQLLDLHLSKA